MGIQHVWIVEPALYKQHKTERHIARVRLHLQDSIC